MINKIPITSNLITNFKLYNITHLYHMLEDQPEKLRKYGYDILINRFEPLFRTILINEVLLINYGLNKWKEGIPRGVIEVLKEEKDIDISTTDINDFFDEIYLWGLKEISVYSNNYKHLKDFVSQVGKEKFIEILDELNEFRKKIAHSKTFTRLDLFRVIELIKNCFGGKLSEELLNYINNEGYTNVMKAIQTLTIYLLISWKNMLVKIICQSKSMIWRGALLEGEMKSYL